MKRTLITTALGLLLMLPVAALTQPAMAQLAPEGTITTQGHGEVKVKPDSLSVEVTIQSQAEKLADVRQENNRKAQAIIKALKSLDIPNLKLETRNVQIFPIQGDRQKDRLPRVIGYQATNSLHVTVTGATPEMLGDTGSRVVDAALNAGSNYVGGLNFYVDDMTPARMQALSLAVKDAKNNAQAMAQAADIALSGVYSLEGAPQYGGGYPRPVPMMMKSAMAAEAAEPIPVETGETTITSDITARFKF